MACSWSWTRPKGPRLKPASSLLQAIIGAVVRVPELRSKSKNAFAIDVATCAMLKRNGVEGLRWVEHGYQAEAPPQNPTDLVEWASSFRPLAIPMIASFQRSTLAQRRRELLDGIVTALLELNAETASIGLRWLAVLSPTDHEAELIEVAARRTMQLGAASPRIRFDCYLATRILLGRHR